MQYGFAHGDVRFRSLLVHVHRRLELIGERFPLQIGQYHVGVYFAHQSHELLIQLALNKYDELVLSAAMLAIAVDEIEASVNNFNEK